MRSRTFLFLLFCFSLTKRPRGLNVLGYKCHQYCNVTILIVVAKDLSISLRFSPRILFCDANSALLHLVSRWLSFTHSCSHAFRYGTRIKEIIPARTVPTNSYSKNCKAIHSLLHSDDELVSIIYESEC